MRTIAEWLVGAKSAPAQINLVTFLDDIAGLVFDDVGAGDLIGSVLEWGDDHRIAHVHMLVRQPSSPVDHLSK